MRAFAKCCVDYAGPFITKITRRVSAKRYLCLFTCSATRAVHLGTACSLSTTDFLNAFSRMVATRGRPEEVTSDNGTNFVGADRELRELVLAMDQEQIADNAASDGIRWNWNLPLRLHFGGVFESLVKVAKKTLKAVVGNAGLTDDELQTAIKEVEALMNSKPLTYEGADPRDEPVLTPNHFLVGQLGGQLAPHFLFRHWTTSLRSHVRYAHADRGISCPRSFSSERLCMQRSGEYLDNSTDKSGENMASDGGLEQRLLADELSYKNEATTVKSMPKVLTSLVDKVETMSSKIFNMDKSIKRLQSNRDAPCSNEGPSNKQRLTAQIEVEEDDDNSDAEGLRRRNEPDADSVNEGHMSDTHDLEQEEEVGGTINQQLADIVNKRWSTKLPETKQKEKMEKYSRPSNCEKLIVPRVKAEI